MIKSILRLGLVLTVLFVSQAAQPIFAQVQPLEVPTSVPPRDLKKRLKKIPGVKKVKQINISNHFKTCYEIWFKQQIDPKNKKAGTFLQKVYLSEYSPGAPVVAELEGYTAYSAKANELSTLLKANQIRIEHRYFDKSMPKKGIPWETLTVENAAYDHHVIINAIRDAIYPSNKFITTGISKGGQTTMLHRSFYPDDVDASVCYVAPLNFMREDPRIYSFLNTVATPEERQAVQDFQLLCFERKDALVELLKSVAEKNGYAWDISIEKAFEYYVLEYSFAFWQWGAYEANKLPDSKATDSVILSHLLNVSGVSFFEQHGVEDLRSYFWAALTEMGIYGYEYEPFKDCLSQQSDYLFDFTAPDGHTTEFDAEPMNKLNNFIQFEAETMLFIYGEYDTWSATAVELGEEAQARGLKKYVNPKGHHDTRIANFDSETKAEIIATIKGWIEK
ncbi:MAG: aminopeptidase [Crocinitomix sp.]|nr:aminopeptidase [Crocinitomix sp.]